MEILRADQNHNFFKEMNLEEDKDRTLTAESFEPFQAQEISDFNYSIRRPTSIPIDKRQHVHVPFTQSPIGATLNAELGADLHRTVQSEPFNLSQKGEPAVISDIRVYLPDGKALQIPVEDAETAMSAELLSAITDHLEIEEDVGAEALALWLISPLLEIQLKPHHKVYAIRQKWAALLRRFSLASEDQITYDEPLLVIRRNVHLSVVAEIEYEDQFECLTEVLYLHAKDEYLSGRYIVDMEQSRKLAALLMAVEHGTFDKDQEAMEVLSEELPNLIPQHLINKCKSFFLFGLNSMECKKGCERQILNEYKAVLEDLQDNHQRRKSFLNILRRNPCYGAAFFYGSIDRRPASSWLAATKRFFSQQQQLEIRIGINNELITVADDKTNELLLTRRVLDCSWFSSQEDNLDEEIPSFFLHFPDDSVLEKMDESELSGHESEMDGCSGASIADDLVTRLIQVFSKQASLIDALLVSIKDRTTSDYGSNEDISIESPESQSTEDPISLPAHSHKTLSTRSVASSRNSLAKSTRSNWSTFSNMSTYSNSKLSKLCVATIDPEGKCTEAHEARKGILETPIPRSIKALSIVYTG
ncbi:unnamed protein product [Bursaphelenchus xylophilus]|uniref:FERM domain-containing protein 8 n=1 Tax=Bursaphelenchus xylophilus TaxID=6326 RepID=A0A7I8X4K0_BURXY|nr:unnamed protein product [Bursaphelenchus xylophilus]CAG9122104.1 unnamed protein product [Bursaphelenchus xylophilus]